MLGLGALLVTAVVLFVMRQKLKRKHGSLLDEEGANGGGPQPPTFPVVGWFLYFMLFAGAVMCVATIVKDPNRQLEFPVVI